MSLLGLCYLLIIILLLTSFLVRAFKSKYGFQDWISGLDSKYQLAECASSTWIDTLITILTLAAVVLGSALLFASLKYVSESENPKEQPKEVSVVDKTEDFIRRNSQQQQVPSTINRSPSFGSGSWLSAVRTEAYETHRRMSMAPTTAITLNLKDTAK